MKSTCINKYRHRHQRITSTPQRKRTCRNREHTLRDSVHLSSDYLWTSEEPLWPHRQCRHLSLRSWPPPSPSPAPSPSRAAQDIIIIIIYHMLVHCQLSGTTIKNTTRNSSLISPHVMHYVSFLSVNPVKYRRCGTYSETFHSIGKEGFSSRLLKIAALILNYFLIFALIILPLSLLCDCWAWSVLMHVLVDSFIPWLYWFQLFSQYNIHTNAALRKDRQHENYCRVPLLTRGCLRCCNAPRDLRHR